MRIGDRIKERGDYEFQACASYVSDSSGGVHLIQLLCVYDSRAPVLFILRESEEPIRKRFGEFFFSRRKVGKGI